MLKTAGTQRKVFAIRAGTSIQKRVIATSQGI